MVMIARSRPFLVVALAVAVAVGTSLIQRVDARLGGALNESQGLTNLNEDASYNFPMDELTTTSRVVVEARNQSTQALRHLSKTKYNFPLGIPKGITELNKVAKLGESLLDLGPEFFTFLKKFFSFDCGGGFAALDSLADIGFNFSGTPLSFLGDVNLYSILEHQLDRVLHDVGLGSILLPQKVCTTDKYSLSQLGQKNGIKSCAYMTSLSDIDVWAFGGGIGEKDLCAAISFETLTVSFAQQNIIPPLNIPIPETRRQRQLQGEVSGSAAASSLAQFLKSIKVSFTPKVISLSFLRGLNTPTLTKLWNGVSAPAIANVPGNFRFGGAGNVGFGWGAAGYDIKGTIEFDGSFTFDSDYSGESLEKVLRGDLISMAFLIQGKIIPKFDIFQIYSLNFAAVFKGFTADMYAVLSGDESRIQIGVTVALDLGGICKIAPDFEWLCKVFSTDASLSGSIYTYLSKEGLGVMLDGEGQLKFNPNPLYDWLLDLIDYPKDGIYLGATITAQLGYSSTVCIKLKEDLFGDEHKKWCTPANYGRGVGTLPGRVADCPPGYKNMGLTCLRPADSISAPSQAASCPSGYTNMGLTCFRGNDEYSAPSQAASCPSGYTNMGLTCYRGPNSIYAPSIVADCPSGYTNMGLTCYKFPFSSLGIDSMSCPGGYFKCGPRCCVNCQSGYTNTGDTCLREASSLGWDSFTCPSGYFKSTIDKRCCKRCRPGYTNTGETCNRVASTLSADSMTCPSGYFKSKIDDRCCKNCPAGYTNEGETCYRGPKTIGLDAMTCPSNERKIGLRCFPASGNCFDGKEEDDGLCYKKCNPGYKGIGPMCWKVKDKAPSS